MGKDKKSKANKPGKKVQVHHFETVHPIKTDETLILEKEVDQLYRQIRKFKNLLETPSKEEMAIPSDLAKDYELKQLLEKYDHSYKEFEAVLSDCKKQMKSRRKEEGYLDILKKDVSTAQEKLPGINADIISLYNQIAKRHDIIAPKLSTISGLQDYLTEAKKTLNVQLASLDKSISAITLVDMDSPDSKFFQNELEKLCISLKSFLDDEILTIDASIKAPLIEKMCGLVGVWTRIQFMAPSIRRKEPVINTELLLKKIAATYHALSAIKDLPFENPCNYFSKKNKELSQKEDLLLLEKELSDNNLRGKLNEWINNLQNELLLFDGDYDTHPSLQESRDLKHQLLDIQLRLSNLKELEFESCPPESTAEKRLALLKQNLKVLKKRNLTLQGLEKEIQSKSDNWQRIYKDLQEKYQNERLHLKDMLSKELETTLDALALIDSSPYHNDMLELQKLPSWIETEVKRKPLSEFKKVAVEKIVILHGYIGEVKLKLLELKAPLNKEIQLAHEEFNMSELHDDNPCQRELYELNQQLVIETTALNEHLNKLTKLPGNKLTEWFDNFDQKYEAAKEHTEKRRRISTRSYQTSAGIVVALNNEIARLTKRYIDRAIARPGCDAETVKQLQTIKKDSDFLLKKSYLPELTPHLLNQIDPRLEQLTKLRKEFTELNDQYISSDLTLLDDDKFNKELKEKVNQQLHHDHMEIYSDAKRLKLVQWIRTHVLKPIVALKYQAGAYLKRNPEANPYTFFVTPGASITERCIAETGHEAYKTLNAGAPAA